jgi:hypothetical protein
MYRVVFYYPSKNIGGTQLLFVRLAQYLQYITNVEVFYVDFVNGFARETLMTSKVTFIDFVANEKLYLPKNSCVVIPANYLFQIEHIIKNLYEIRLMIWSLHPLNIIPNFYDFKSYSLVSKKILNVIGVDLKRLYYVGGLQFMDHSNYITNSNYFNFQIPDTSYLPIPVEEVIFQLDLNSKHERLKNHTINISWLGRIDIDKIFSILNLCNEIENLSKNKKFVFYVIGEGSQLEFLQERAIRYSFEIVFLGKLFGEELQSFIVKNVDVGVAMGTSALEFAKFAKPVILIDVCNKEYSSNTLRYNLLHQTIGYSLGSVFPFKNNEIRKFLFGEALSNILDNYLLESHKAQQYVQLNHSIAAVGELFFTKIMRLFQSETNEEVLIVGRLGKIYNDNKLSYKSRILDKIRRIVKFKLVKI